MIFTLPALLILGYWDTIPIFQVYLFIFRCRFRLSRQWSISLILRLAHLLLFSPLIPYNGFFSSMQTFLIAFIGGCLGVLFSIPLRRTLLVDPSLRFPVRTITTSLGCILISPSLLSNVISSHSLRCIFILPSLPCVLITPSLPCVLINPSLPCVLINPSLR